MEREQLIQEICRYIQTLPLQLAAEEDPHRQNPFLFPMLEHFSKVVALKIWKRFMPKEYVTKDKGLDL